MPTPKKRFSFFCILNTVLVFSFLSSLASAACTSPSGVSGQITWTGGAVKFCNGTDWKSTVHMSVSSCSGTAAGTFTYSASKYQYCDGTNWMSMKGSAMTSCSGTPASTLTWDSGSSVVKFCDGTNWYDTTGDPCAGSPSIGTECADGTVYAGLSADGNVPMYTTHCDYGMTWNGSSCTGTASTESWGGYADVGTYSSTTGRSNSSTIAGTGTGAPYAPASNCEGLNSNGKTDWYLPAKSELETMLITNYTAIGGFNTGVYYQTSSEVDTYTLWVTIPASGSAIGAKAAPGSYRYRCVRR